MTIETTHSSDGTLLTFEAVGEGPALILVGGAFNDRNARSAGTPLAASLKERYRVLSYDRRGRGGSGDRERYDHAREIDDLGALIDVAGGSAFVFGISSGGLLGLDAAVRGLPITKLAAYEPPVILEPQRVQQFDALAEQLARATAEGRRGDAAELFLTQVVQMPAQVVQGMRAAPFWRGLEALAHTLSYDVRITARGPARLAEVSQLAVPTLLLQGSASPPWMREAIARLGAAIPGATQRTLQGQTHDVDVAVLAGALRDFFD